MSKYMYWGYLYSNHEIYPMGWFDMSDFDKGWDELFKEATSVGERIGAEPVHPIRGDVIDDLISDLECLFADMNETNPEGSNEDYE